MDKNCKWNCIIYPESRYFQIKLRSHGQSFFGSESLAKNISQRVCVYKGQIHCPIKFAIESLPKSLRQIIFF